MMKIRLWILAAVTGACLLTGCFGYAGEMTADIETLIVYDASAESIKQLADGISSLTGGQIVRMEDVGEEIGDTVYIGLDSWDGKLPPAVNTFLAEHDFTGKSVIPFGISEDAGELQTDLLTEAFRTAGETANIPTGYLTAAGRITEQEPILDWLAQIGQITPITIQAGETVLTGILFGNATAQEFAELLPIETNLYEPADFAKAFNLENQMTEPGSRTRAYELGGLAYWPEGPAVAIFHSDHVEQTVVPVYTLGKILDDVELFRDYRSTIIIELK